VDSEASTLGSSPGPESSTSEPKEQDSDLGYRRLSDPFKDRESSGKDGEKGKARSQQPPQDDPSTTSDTPSTSSPKTKPHKPR